PISAVLLYTLSRTSDSPPVCFLVNDTLSVCESFVFLFVITPTFIIEPEKSGVRLEMSRIFFVLYESICRKVSPFFEKALDKRHRNVILASFVLKHAIQNERF
ncbi:MAG: hypothetical protein SO010_07240, partial [Candidatus Limiplasma sp.]|nr:hypothetical protein [Candidatus Limiplasma sp.]